MNKEHKKGKKEKYSTQNPSPRLLQTLKNIYFNQGGTISYIFLEERIKFTNQHPKGKIIKLKSSLVSSINTQVFFKESRGKLYKRSTQEILKIFEDTKNDLGASYFVIN